MITASKILRSVWTACGIELVLLGTLGAQEKIETPSQKTAEAVQKFIKTPATISKNLEALTDAAKAKLQQTLGEKPATSSKAGSDDLTLPPKQPSPPAGARFSPDGKRDPFQPMTLRTKTSSRPRENLSPLEQVELGQLKVTGIVWDIKEPKAMIEDSTGLGYIAQVGTPIGSHEGKIKAIHRNEVVVEEFYSDSYGAKKKRDISLKLSTD
jgi:Tfp pilus assembly protein PilP